jgi:ribosome maturation factor RimP
MTPRGHGAGLRAQAARLAEVIEPVTRRAGLDLEGVAVSRLGRRHLVRVVVDGDGGVDLDTVAEVSRSMSTALDAAEAAGATLVTGEYVLEVSSPGVDRPLTEARHWRRNVGRLVTVPVSQVSGTRRLTGRVVAADDARVVLEVEGAAHELAHDRLGPGRVQVELRREDGAAAGAEVGEDQ